MSDPSRCWALRPFRPMVLKALVREFRYVYAAIGPQEGSLDWDGGRGDEYRPDGNFPFPGRNGLSRPGSRHGSRWSLSPSGQRTGRAGQYSQRVCLPPYSPELNPTQILWHELREKFCSNRVFDMIDAVVDQVKKGLADFSEQHDFVSRLSGWPWIMDSILMDAK